MTRLRTRLMAALAVAGLGVTTLAATGGTAQALSNPPNPALTPDPAGPISSHPFPGGGGVNASDVEGIAYIPGDGALWVADDNRDRIYELDTDGNYQRSILAGAFQTATAVGSGTPADASRTDDLESIVYDEANDVMYVTSGNCCGVAPFNPTVFKLTRNGSGDFTPTSWQPLPEGQDATAAGWRPGTGMYFGKGSKIKTYNFDTNTVGSDISLPVSPIVGIHFDGANTAFVTTATANTAAGRTTADSDSTIHRFDISGATWTENLAWKFSLKNTGMIDARDMTIIGDQFLVTDGYDYRTNGDHPIYRYQLVNATASFVAVPTTGNRPLTVGFFDSSTGNPTSWDWDFGDGTAHGTTKIVSHTYNTAGNYTATLTVGWGGTTDTTSQNITVKVPTGAPGGYILDGFGGLHAVRVGNGGAPKAVSGNPDWPGWDIARGVAIKSDKTGGYELDGFGGIHPFALGNNSKPSGAIKGGGYWPGWDIARGIALLPNGKSGYMLDGFGGIHRFAIGSASLPPTITGNPYWQGQDMARGIMLTTDGKGGYVVDKTGKLYRFKVTGGAKPAAANSVGIVSAVQMQGGSFISDNTGGFTVDGFGGTHGFGTGGFGPPPNVSSGPYWPGWDIARDLALSAS